MHQYQKYFFTHDFENDPLNSTVLLESYFETSSPYMLISGICYSAGYYKGIKLSQGNIKLGETSARSVTKNGRYCFEHYFENNLTLYEFLDRDSPGMNKMIPKPAFVF
jgi:hypothetical protein